MAGCRLKDLVVGIMVDVLDPDKNTQLIADCTGVLGLG